MAPDSSTAPFETSVGAATADPRRLVEPPWRSAWVSFAAGFVALIALFHTAALEAVEIWYSNATFNHGFLILPIAGYLLWIRRTSLARLTPQPSYWGALLLAVLAAVWLVGWVASVRVVYQFALVGMIQALFLTVMGWRVAKALAFPLLYLYFMVPFGDFLVQPLQDFTAEFSVRFLRLVGVPVFLDGIFIAIPEGNFVVAEACAGLRFLIATLALGFLFANLTYRSPWRRLAFIVLSVVVPIIANGFRAAGIVLVGHLSDMTIAVGVDHIIYGWVFFALVTVLLLAIGMSFRDRDVDDPVRVDTTVSSSAGHGARGFAAAAVAAVALAAWAPAYAEVIDGRTVPPLPPGAFDLPAAEGWTTQPLHVGDWRPVFPGAAQTVTRRYQRGGQAVDLFVAYYPRQNQKAEMIGYHNSFADEVDWQRAASGRATAPVDGQEMTVDRIRLRGRVTDRMVWSWYWIDGRFTASRPLAKALQAAVRLLSGHEGAAVVAVSTEFDEDQAQAENRLTDFLRALGPLDGALTRVAGR